MGANTGPDNSALIMDLGIPLGNSEDVFLKQALHVKVGNKPSEPIPTYAVDTPGTEEVEFGTANTALGGGSVDLINVTVPVGATWYPGLIQNSCRCDAQFEIRIDGSLIGRVRTGPGCHNAPFSFDPKLPIQGGTSVKVSVVTSSYVPQTTADSTFTYAEIT